MDGVWVLGLVEQTADMRIEYVLVEKRDLATLTAVIRRYVAPGAVIYTDEWWGYRKMSDFFDHRTVNHFLGFVNTENSVHTNTIEGNWFFLKISLLFAEKQLIKCGCH